MSGGVGMNRMKLKHTPGPWKTTRIDNLNHILIVKEGGDFPGGRNLIEIASVIIDSNARLIATTPEMLNALIKAQKIISGNCTDLIMNKSDRILIDLNNLFIPIIEKATGMKIEEILQEKP